MEDRFREAIRKLMAERGLSAPEVAREVGLDKGYFIDLLAGRKKSVTASAFMAVAAAYKLDPWDMAGMERPGSLARQAPRVEEKAEVRPPFPAARPAPVPAVRVGAVVEEGAFRVPGEIPVAAAKASLPPLAMFAPSRQTVCLVRGDDYAKWGVCEGSLVTAVSFKSYGTVAQAGSLVVVRGERGAVLSSTVMRRLVVDGDGLQHTQAPSGSVEPFPDPHSLVGLVLSSQYVVRGVRSED